MVVAFFTRTNGTLAPIYSVEMAKRAESYPQFAGWDAFGGTSYVDRNGVTRIS